MLPPVEFLPCSGVLDRLEEWLDGELGPDEMVAVENHVEGCLECAREFRLARAIRNELSGLPSYTPSSDMAEAAVAATSRAHAATVPNHSWSVAKRPLQLLAVAAMVVFAVVLVGPSKSPTSPTYTEEEVQRAVADTKLALGYLGSISRRTEAQVRTKVFGDRAVSATVHGISRTLKWAGDSVSEKSETPPREIDEGSL